MANHKAVSIIIWALILTVFMMIM